jgi:hypothetical protein
VIATAQVAKDNRTEVADSTITCSTITDHVICLLLSKTGFARAAGSGEFLGY